MNFGGGGAFFGGVGDDPNASFFMQPNSAPQAPQSIDPMQQKALADAQEPNANAQSAQTAVQGKSDNAQAMSGALANAGAKLITGIINLRAQQEARKAQNKLENINSQEASQKESARKLTRGEQVAYGNMLNDYAHAFRV